MIQKCKQSNYFLFLVSKIIIIVLIFYRAGKAIGDAASEVFFFSRNGFFQSTNKQNSGREKSRKSRYCSFWKSKR
jgi:hypothetical protein